MLQFLVNKAKNHRWATMIELMAMISILGLGVWSMFTVITSGIYFAKDTEDTIKAINLAREGIEWVTSIRNTNWLRFSSDRTNCWQSNGYDALCIGNAGLWARIGSGTYTLYPDRGLWYLSWATIIDPVSNWTTYSTQYATRQDNLWFFTQSGSMPTQLCTSLVNQNCKTIFTREIQINANPLEMSVKSIVYWNTKRLQKIELETTLTNWKSKF